MGCQCGKGNVGMQLPYQEQSDVQPQRKSVMDSDQFRNRIKHELAKDIDLKNISSQQFHQCVKKHVNQVFNRYDNYKKGFLDKQEFTKFLIDNTHQEFSTEEVDDLIERIDINQNGLIQENQLLSLYENLLSQQSKIEATEKNQNQGQEQSQVEKHLTQYVHKLFDKYDTYGKGFLDKDELKSLLKENTDQNFNEEEVMKLIARIDNNKNELIEEKQLLAMYRELYSQKNEKNKNKRPDLQNMDESEFNEHVKKVVHKIFEKYDGYGKGFLDRMQFLQLLKEKTDSHFTEDEIDELISKIDMNHNELIQESELYVMYRQVLQIKYKNKKKQQQ